MPYFGGHSWSDLTREERFYCFTLYEHARTNPADFAQWVAQTAGRIDITEERDWDLGVEVCLYRDILWHRHKRVRGTEYSPKRTFDLCLFGTHTIIIIEAKVFQAFDAKQNEAFEKDAKSVKDLLEKKDLNVFLVALASRRYFEDRYGNGEVLKLFKGRKITWNDAYEKYQDKLLLRADELYRSKDRMLAVE